MSLADELKKRQGDMGEIEFAALIGIRQSTLNRLYHNRQKLGAVVARKIKLAFPELDVAHFLFADEIPTEHRSDPSAA